MLEPLLPHWLDVERNLLAFRVASRNTYVYCAPPFSRVGNKALELHPVLNPQHFDEILESLPIINI